MIGASPSSGSSSSSSLGFSTSARATASICCSPPESWWPRLAARSAKPREQRVDALRRPRPRPGDGGQVLVDGQRLEDVALLRHPADARGGAPVRRQAREVLRRRARCGPARRRVTPTSVSSSVVLPVPLRPSSASDCPCVEREVDALDDDGLAVAGAQVLDAQQLSHARLRLAEIDRRDARVARRSSPASPSAKHRAVDQHGHALREAEDEVHVVLDQQHRRRRPAAPRRCRGSPAARLRARRRPARRAAARAAGRRARSRSRAAAACRRRARRRCWSCTSSRWNWRSSASHAGADARHRPRAAATSRAPMPSCRATAERERLQRRQAAEELVDLEGAHEAAAHAPVRREPR